MSGLVRIQLSPLDKALHVPRGASLQDVLFEHGVEFPCGGRGLCKGCKVKVLSGDVPASAEDRQHLSPEELEAGWRLSCCLRATADLKLQLGQWDTPVLLDNSRFEFTPQNGLGVAVDIGTTTIAAQLLELRTGHVLSVHTALNAQARHGSDIMSRVEFAVTEAGQPQLQTLLREQVGRIVLELLNTSVPPSRHRELARIILVGNTVMHHLFCGISVEPLSRYPFETSEPGLRSFVPAELEWTVAPEAQVWFLPCLGGFVGSDILAGIVATGLHKSELLGALIDLGTNAEIVVGNRDRMLCASTAAGPAFEGARISMGMRAATGAISEVHLNGSELQCHVLGNSEPRGVCGSGLVDAVAAGLELGRISPNGRLAGGESFSLQPPVALNQWDIRELQLAKGAIAVGIRLLLDQWGAGPQELKRVYLAGAFGNYVRQASARRIGLLDFDPQMVVPSGNTALLGAKLALFTPDQNVASCPEILNRITHVSLHEDPRFQESYAEQMLFPAPSPKAPVN